MGPTTVAASCSRWSDWINDHSPSSNSSGGGDRESLSAAALAARGFCADGRISDIECRDVKRHQLPRQMGDVGVGCSLQDGLWCDGRRQALGRCHDYHVRYYCQCHAMEGAGSTTPVFIWSPENQSYATCEAQQLLPLLGI